MAALKSGLVAVALVAGLAGSAQAQFVTSGFQGGGSPPIPGPGSTPAITAINGGFGNYGLPGAYPGYAGYGLSGYGPGPTWAVTSPRSGPTSAPQTYNNMGGLIEHDPDPDRPREQLRLPGRTTGSRAAPGPLSANRFRAWYRSGAARPLILAHRGDSFRAPENTLEAARSATRRGPTAGNSTSA